MAIGKSDYQILCELKSKQSISEVLTHNNLGLDRGDLDLFLLAYHEDALVEHDMFSESAAAYYKRILAGTCDKTLSSMRFTSNVLIEIDEMTRTIAVCESYFQAVVRFQRGAEVFDQIECGRCFDHFEVRTGNKRCRMGSWKISHRVILSDWSRTERVAEQKRERQDRNDLGARHITEKAVLSFFDRRKTSMTSSRISPPSGHQSGF